MTQELLVGCYTGDRGRGTGIAVVTTSEGIPSRVDRIIAADSPSFVVRHPTLPVLYAVVEDDHGRVEAWSSERSLGRGGTGGADPCHLTVEPLGRFLITANYGGGSVSVHALDTDGRIGERVDFVQHERHGKHERQESAHAHMVRLTDLGLLAVDLGGDALYRYQLDDGRLTPIGIVDTPTGSGPRHVTMVGDRWFVNAELSAEVLTYTADWLFLGAVSATRADRECLPSELVASADGRFLYVANRGPDTIAVFALGDDLPVYVTEVPTGAGPRHIALAGDLLYVANEKSDELITMRLDSETGVPALVAVLAVPSPTCVLLP